MKRGTFLSLVFCLVLLASATTHAEDSLKIGWNQKAIGNLNFSQSSFDNWVQGGENSWSWLANFAARFTYKQEQWELENSGKIEYGQSKIGDVESKKSADEIFLETLLAHDLAASLQFYAAANGRTQFADGFNYSTDPKVLISRFMNPGYFTESAGLRYKPQENFSSRLGLGVKQTVVTEELFAPIYTDEIGTTELEKLRNAFGLQSVSEYNLKLAENLSCISSLDLFSNLKALDQIEVRWDNLIKADIVKYVAVSFSFQLFYDHKISPKRQLKQVLGVGLTYRLL